MHEVNDLKKFVKPRVLILIGLMDGKPRSRKELAKELDLSWPTVDATIFKLVSEGLVKEKEGRFIITDKGRSHLKHILNSICKLNGDF